MWKRVSGLALVDWMGVACVLVVAARTALLPFKEGFSWESEAWDLAYDVALALLTGWFLNLLVVTLPRQRAQRMTYEVLGSRMQSLGGLGRSIAQTLAGHVGTPLTEQESGPTDDEWRSLCRALQFRTPLTTFMMQMNDGTFGPGRVISLLQSEIRRADRLAAPLLQAAPYFDAEFNALMQREQTSSLRSLIENAGVMQNSSLENAAQLFIDYDSVGRDISAYYEQFVRPYTSNRLQPGA